MNANAAATGIDAVAALALVEDVGTVGIWSWNLETDALVWSGGMYRLLGLEAFSEPASVELFQKTIHPDHRLDLTDPVLLAATNAFDDRRFKIVRSDGEMRWIRSCARVVRARDGTPTQLLGAAFDITDLRRGLEAHQQEAGLLSAARELLGGFIWKTAPDGTVADLMEWRMLVGRHGSRHKGWKRLDDVHPEDRQIVRDAWDEALRSRTRYSAEYRAMWEGSYAHISSRALPIRDARGDILGWIGYSTPRPIEAASLTFGSTVLSAAQVRAGRGFLNWTARELADRAGISFSTVRRIEMPGTRVVGARPLEAVRTAFENAGLTFTEAPDGAIGVVMSHEARTANATTPARKPRQS